MLLRSAVATLLLLTILALPVSGRAQVIDHFGVKAGVVSASASGDFSDEVSGDQFGRRTGWVASLFVEKQVLPFLTVLGEIGYTERGFTERIDHEIQRGSILYDDPAVQATSRLTYLVIPVMAKFSYDIAPVSLYALAGPQAKVVLHRETGWFDLSNGRFRSFTGHYYDPPLGGGTTGVGVATESWFPARVSLEARYDFALSGSRLNNSFGPYEIRSNALTTTVGIAF